MTCRSRSSAPEPWHRRPKINELDLTDTLGTVATRVLYYWLRHSWYVQAIRGRDDSELRPGHRANYLHHKCTYSWIQFAVRVDGSIPVKAPELQPSNSCQLSTNAEGAITAWPRPANKAATNRHSHMNWTKTSFVSNLASSSASQLVKRTHPCEPVLSIRLGSGVP